MITLTPARSSSAEMRRVASRPSTPGIRMSISTTSARSRRARSTAWAPSVASPTTSRSSAASMSTWNPARISAWSSASRTRITAGSFLGRGGWVSRRRRRPLRSGGSAAWPGGWSARRPAEGQPGRDPEAAGRARSGLDGTADGGGALSHPGEPVAAAVPRDDGLAAAGVGHVDAHLVVLVAQGNRGGGRAGVPDGVGQRFLDDPVGGQVHRGRQRHRVAGHGERRLQARPAGSRDEVLEPGGARCRLGRVGVVGLAQHVQDGAQFPEPLLARGLDRLQGLGGRLRAGGQDVGGHPGLHVDGGHGVGHDVVQLAGDAQSFLVEAAAGILFGPVADGGHVGVPVRHRDPGEQRRGDHERDDVEPAAADVPERVVRRGDRHQDGERREGRYEGPADSSPGWPPSTGRGWGRSGRRR